MSGHNMIVIGASVGRVEGLVRLVQTLPAQFPTSVFVVLHIPAHKPSAPSMHYFGQQPRHTVLEWWE